MNQHKKISLIILTYNSEQDIFDCLQSVYQNNGIGDALEVIVVDNNSTHWEHTKQQIKSQYPQVISISNSNNGGYGKGNNVGIYASTAPIIAIMNPDVRLTMPSTFNTIIHTLCNEEIVLCGGKQYTEKGEQCQSFWYDFMSPIICQTLFLPIQKRLDIFIDKNMWLSGAFFAIKKEAFSDIGLFDEELFMYCEENDIMRRLHKKNPKAKIKYLPDLHYIHCIGKRLVSKSSIERELASQLYLCRKFDISNKTFVKHEIRKIKLSTLVSFFLTGNTHYTPYHKYRLELLRKIMQ